jgi:hypothetical protein
MTLVGPKRTIDPLRNYPRVGNQAGVHPAYTRRHDDVVSPARELVLEFLRARLEANNARIEFILDPSSENMTAWATAENLALGDTE